MIDQTWHDKIKLDLFLMVLEYIGTFAGALSGVRLACIKRFDWFGASVIGFITALGGGTLRDVMLQVRPFWMTDFSFVATTFLAVIAVWAFGRRFIAGQVTWFIFDTIAISVFMIIGLEKAIVVSVAAGWQCGAWCAIMMGVITAVFGGVMRDICINEVPLIFRKELYALACAAGGVMYYLLVFCGVSDPYVRYVAGVLTVFVVRALAIKYHLGIPVLTGRRHIDIHLGHGHEHPHHKKGHGQ